MATAIIVGCGGIGIRHAQAACDSTGIDRVVIVEPNIDRSRQVVSQLQAEAPRIALSACATLDSLPADIGKAAIAVAAVTADILFTIFEKLMAIESTVYLIEKPIAQSAENIDTMLKRVRNCAADSKVYVNCSRNMWEPYAQIRSKIIGATPSRLHMEVFGPSWGLGCNAVHFLELLRWTTGSDEIHCTNASLTPALAGNKRGDQYEEFVGTAAFQTNRGDTTQLTSSGDPSQPAGITVLAKTTQGAPLACLIEENPGVVWDFHQAKRETFKPAFVRATTRGFIEAVLASGGSECPLPTMAQAAIAHRALFQALAAATKRSVFAIT